MVLGPYLKFKIDSVTNFEPRIMAGAAYTVSPALAFGNHIVATSTYASSPCIIAGIGIRKKKIKRHAFGAWVDFYHTTAYFPSITPNAKQTINQIMITGVLGF